MNIAAHSVLPWTAERLDTTRVMFRGTHRIKNAIGQVPALAMDEDDAALIIQRVNAHDELVAALRECMGCMDSLRDFVSEGGSRHMIGAGNAIRDADEAFDNAHAVLAKVSP